MDINKAYKDKMQAQMKESEAKVEQIRAQAQKAQAETKIEYNHQAKEASGKMKDLREAGSDAWNELKQGIKDAGTDLSSAIDKASNRMR